jgi:hypothetical protein
MTWGMRIEHAALSWKGLTVSGFSLAPAERGGQWGRTENGLLNKTLTEGKMGYFRILAAIPGFFLSSLFLMLLWGVIAPQFDIATASYALSMLVTITLWLAVAPLAAVGRGHRKWQYTGITLT